MASARTTIVSQLYKSTAEVGSAADVAFDMKSEYAVDTFDVARMRAKLPKKAVQVIQNVLQHGDDLDAATADTIANAMKEWALSHGCTHYTHWFSPLRATTAEKHDSFLELHKGQPIMEFSGALLIRGEPDASSFPSGGTRETSQARGYTAWDPSTPVFIRNVGGVKTLTIPTVFCSWTGEALDMKIPLLRSVEALSREATALLNTIQCNPKGATSVYATLGCEQEFFLVDEQFYNARPDLYNTGRTLIGARPPKGQEAEDHYFGIMPERVIACIHDVERRLWKLGIPTKTRHNEVAPSQFEMAPIFERADTAADHNLIVMEVLEQTAREHGLVCLMHEKPFEGMNGSGKHNNWSMATNAGENLLDPTDAPSENPRFLACLAAVVKGVDEHPDLLRASVAVPGNDHRLGANEAPPAIISVYLGEVLYKTVSELLGDMPRPGFDAGNAPPQAAGGGGADDDEMELGVNALPKFKRDPTDRNRTSPFAFVGNKFEFRAVGSSQNVAIPCMVLNVVVAEALAAVRADIEAFVAGGVSVQEATMRVVKQTLASHFKVIFEGDGYGAAWVREAERRGLPNYPSTPEALSHWCDPKNLDLFQRHAVLTQIEMTARRNVWLEHYATTLRIEARALRSLVQSTVVPAGVKHQGDVADSIAKTRAVLPDADHGPLLEHVRDTLAASTSAQRALKELDVVLAASNGLHGAGPQAQADHVKEAVVPAMQKVRDAADAIETLVANDLWTLPTYSEMVMLK